MSNFAMETITVRLADGTERVCPRRTELKTLLPAPAAPNGFPYVAALVNNEVTSLSYALEVDSRVEFLTMADPEGWPVYERSLSFLLAKTVKELFPQAAFSIEYALGDGLYCSLEPQTGGGKGVTAETVQRIEQCMRKWIADDVPILRRKLSFEEACRRFSESGQQDKLNLLRYRNPPRIAVHVCEGFYDFAHGPLVPSTGALRYFGLALRPPGFVLQLPDPDRGGAMDPFRDQPHLFRVFEEHKEWGRILGVNTVGRLNEIIVNGDIGEFIKIAEALHEKKVARIADELWARRDQVRLVLIAGPSSSGKTTFAKRLAIQMRVAGLRPVTLSLDNYFLELEQTPRDEKGVYDYEHLEALDLPLFNRQLLDLIEGREADLPLFNFETKRREYRGRRLRIEPDQMILCEGLHGLNPRLTAQVPEERKFHIYVSALTQLSVDSHTRISTTDNRLIRRLVRDHRYRGHSALQTLRLWPSVRRGEERWIFPFQARAQATFNSALDYELAVLKPMVEPLLMEIKPCDREYAVARRLTAVLLNFIGLPDRDVPSTSILREYIGRSGFRY